MNVNQKIENALSEIAKGNIWPLCCPFDSQPDMYIVYNPELEEPGYYADDEDYEWTQYMQVHLYVKGNYIGLRKDIRQSLKSAGFIVTGIETFYEKDSRYYHLCFECYIEEEE
jgi:hypothetical protein